MELEPIIPFEPIRVDSVPEGDQWTYQIKWDGIRLLAYCEGDGSAVRLFNRRKNERTLQYPELTRPALSVASSFVLDGEVIALGADGKPSFHEVMRRDGIRRLDQVPRARAEVPIVYMVFDILYLDGEWVHRRPLRDRAALLVDMVVPGEHVQLVASHPDGQALSGAVRQMGMEGIVCKDLNSGYAPGTKDGRWLKVKNYGDLVAVIGGYTLRDGIVNAVLAGLYREEKLTFIGRVGTGKLTVADWRRLTEKLTALQCAACPFVERHPDMRGAYWARPELTAKIMYSEWRRHEGRHLRQPSIQALVDVPPEQCVWE